MNPSDRHLTSPNFHKNPQTVAKLHNRITSTLHSAAGSQICRTPTRFVSSHPIGLDKDQNIFRSSLLQKTLLKFRACFTTSKKAFQTKRRNLTASARGICLVADH